MKKIVGSLVAAIGFVAILCLYFAGVGYQAGTLELGQAFTLMRWSAIGGIVGVGLVVVCLLWERPGGLRLAIFCLSAVLGLTAFYMPYRQSQLAQQVPPIHDITTNTQDPPGFVDILPLRADAPNPATYEGGEVAQLQQEAYPDLMTLVYAQPVDEVFAAAAAAAEAMGWDMVASVPSQGRIEATATTRWFGFKDDVVIRVRAADSGALVDVRSKSRVGGSDIGANAARIRAYRDELNSRIDS